MRVLLDECLPRRLKRELPEHEARRLQRWGGPSKKNGELLALAAVDFDAFLTPTEIFRTSRTYLSSTSPLSSWSPQATASTI